MDKIKESWNNGYLAAAKPREERIEKLDKENGKLEGKLADLQSEYIELENFHNNEVNGLKAYLTKAKDIIIRLLEVLVVIDGEQTKELKEVREAEQFLKEAEG